MNLAKSLLAVAVFAAASATAFADPVYIRNGVDYDPPAANSGDPTRTYTFDRFTLNTFAPTSYYFGAAGLTTLNQFGGLAVIDVATTFVGSLNPIPGGLASSNGFGSAWGLEVSWELAGLSTIIPTLGGPALTAAIDDGNVDFKYLEGAAAPDSPFAGQTVLNVDVTGSGLGVAGNVEVTLFGNVSQAADNFMYFAAGDRDFHDLIAANVEIGAKGNTELTDAQKVPTSTGKTVGIGGDATLTALYEKYFGALGNQTFTVYSRSTQLTSANIEFSVPAPGTLALLGIGLLAAGGLRRRGLNG